MPDKLFLETYPLYRKFNFELPPMLGQLDAPAIHMYCEVEGSFQTFNTKNDYYELVHNDNSTTEDNIVDIIYYCSSCGTYQRHFLIKFMRSEQYVMKVGQEPPWEITPDPQLASSLGERVGLLKKGLICESQGYGIGAFAYYRRIVEEIIGELLDDVQGLLSGEEAIVYAKAIEEVKKTTVTQDKIQLVKDLLPPILRPGGMNPLSVLHNSLSEGLHADTDERCIALAMEVRDVLIFLVGQVAVTKSASSKFTSSMKKLLDRKSSPG